jgi:hypothetical protein
LELWSFVTGAAFLVVIAVWAVFTRNVAFGLTAFGKAGKSEASWLICV